MSAVPTREERIAAARNRFIVRAQGDAQMLREQARRLDPAAGSELQNIREAAHRIAGTAGSYGFMQATDAAQGLLRLIARDAPREETLAAVERLSHELEQMAGGS